MRRNRYSPSCWLSTLWEYETGTSPFSPPSWIRDAQLLWREKRILWKQDWEKRSKLGRTDGHKTCVEIFTFSWAEVNRPADTAQVVTHSRPVINKMVFVYSARLFLLTWKTAWSSWLDEKLARLSSWGLMTEAEGLTLIRSNQVSYLDELLDFLSGLQVFVWFGQMTGPARAGTKINQWLMRTFFFYNNWCTGIQSE